MLDNNILRRKHFWKIYKHSQRVRHEPTNRTEVHLQSSKCISSKLKWCYYRLYEWIGHNTSSPAAARVHQIWQLNHQSINIIPFIQHTIFPFLSEWQQKQEKNISRKCLIAGGRYSPRTRSHKETSFERRRWRSQLHVEFHLLLW